MGTVRQCWWAEVLSCAALAAPQGTEDGLGVAPDMRAVVYNQAIAGGDAATYQAMRQLYLFVRDRHPLLHSHYPPCHCSALALFMSHGRHLALPCRRSFLPRFLPAFLVSHGVE